MEDRSSRSCRLTLESSTGRVRWCVGNERSWQAKLKILVFLPLCLLLFILTLVLLGYITPNRDATPIATTPSSEGAITVYDSESRNNEEGAPFDDARTTHVHPKNLFRAPVHLFGYRGKRDIKMPDHVNLNDFNNLLDELNKMETANDNSHSNLENAEVDNTTKSSDEDQGPTKPSNDHQRYFWRPDLTKEEVREIQAKFMLKYMDTSVKPCDDFYQYACGNWAKYNPIPKDKSGFDTFEILREILDGVLRDLILDDNIYKEKQSKDDKNPHPTYQTKRVKKKDDAINKMRRLYKSCINEELLDKRGAQPLLDLLKLFGGWPIIETDWDESNFDWLWLIAELRRFNNDVFISQWVGPDIKNSKEYIIQFDQTNLGLPSREYFLEPSNLKYLEAYRVYMITIATLLGSPIVKATEEVDHLVQFEMQLARIMARPEIRKNLSDIYTRVSIGQLQHLVPQIDWMRYLNLVVGKNVLATEPIVCFSMTYVQSLVTLLSLTPRRTIANYILWRFVRHRTNNLDRRFEEAKQRFYYVLYGRERSPPRWQTCIAQVNSNMGMALGSLFVQKFFDENSKNDTLEMTKEIRGSFKELLLKVQWLDSSTKSLANVKIDAMKLGIGYPEFILNAEALADRYKDVETHPDLYFENTLSILKHLAKLEQTKIGHFVNKTTWNSAPAIVNAYYSRNKNQIMFPAGILQPPFYHRYFPRSLNYGGIGVVIGHEITHGFDDKGRLFDQDGNLQRWWRDESILQFHARAQCLIDQYNSFVIPGVDLPVDGHNTQGENIADNGGIKQAFNAYQHWLENNPHEDETLPGLNISNTQLFFLNFAQIWCGSSRPEATRNKIQTAVHSPGQFRVIGTLSNSYDFAEVYQCPVGSPMNPQTKCSIW